MQESKSPLARLVLFAICLAVAGSIVAGVHYFAVDLPGQQALHAPMNGDCLESCDDLFSQCLATNKAHMTGEVYWFCERSRDNCINDCF